MYLPDHFNQLGDSTSSLTHTMNADDIIAKPNSKPNNKLVYRTNIHSNSFSRMLRVFEVISLTTVLLKESKTLNWKRTAVNLSKQQINTITLNIQIITHYTILNNKTPYHTIAYPIEYELINPTMLP